MSLLRLWRLDWICQIALLYSKIMEDKMPCLRPDLQYIIYSSRYVLYCLKTRSLSCSSFRTSRSRTIVRKTGCWTQWSRRRRKWKKCSPNTTRSWPDSCKRCLRTKSRSVQIPLSEMQSEHLSPKALIAIFVFFQVSASVSLELCYFCFEFAGCYVLCDTKF